MTNFPALTHSKNSCCSSLLKHESAIADSGTTNTFVTTNATVSNPNSNAPVMTVKVANGQYSYSKGTATLKLKDLPAETTIAHIMPGFPDSLLSIGNLCDAGLHCTFTRTSVHAYDPITKIIKLQGWRDNKSRLWRFPIVADEIFISTSVTITFRIVLPE